MAVFSSFSCRILDVFIPYFRRFLDLRPRPTYSSAVEVPTRPIPSSSRSATCWDFVHPIWSGLMQVEHKPDLTRPVNRPSHRTTLTLKKKNLLYIKFKIFMIFLPLKKFVIILNFLRPNIIKLWTKFGNKLGCSSLRLQLYLIYFFYWLWILTNPPLNYTFFLYLLYL